MRVIALTGGIGSGKSTVARLLQDAGAIVIDADQVAREIVEPGEAALAEIVARFGEDVLTEAGALDRAGLAAVVFSDPSARQDLEAITHPRIGQRIATKFARVAEQETADGLARVVVLDHPLLVESGLAASHETVVVVEAPEELRVRRLVERGLTADDARARMQVQATDEQRRAVATHVIDNGGDLPNLGAAVAALLATLGLVTAADDHDVEVQP